ncbi:waprin-Rha1-like [Ranitomeya variabilis]|uniref:waprin-Rha1-like n=1 Tax=Ranitomeya variabilis TaxID=490064 RepID=UPI0040572432
MSPVKVSLLLLFFLCCLGIPAMAVSPPKPENDKPGACEKDYPEIACKRLDDTLCAKDYQCPDMLKCCKKGCKMECRHAIFY